MQTSRPCAASSATPGPHPPAARVPTRALPSNWFRWPRMASGRDVAQVLPGKEQGDAPRAGQLGGERVPRPPPRVGKCALWQRLPYRPAGSGSRALWRRLAATHAQRRPQRLTGNMGLLATNRTAADVRKVVEKHKEWAYARSGFEAPRTVSIPAGPLPQFQHTMVEELRRLGLPVDLKDAVITLFAPHVICRKGDTLTPEQCQLLVRGPPPPFRPGLPGASILTRCRAAPPARPRAEALCRAHGRIQHHPLVRVAQRRGHRLCHLRRGRRARGGSRDERGVNARGDPEKRGAGEGSPRSGTLRERACE